MNFHTDADSDFINKVGAHVLQHPELVGLKFGVSAQYKQITIDADSFHVLSLVHRIFLTYKDEQTKEIKDSAKDSKKNNKDSAKDSPKDSSKVSYANLASKIKTTPSSSYDKKQADTNKKSSKSSAKSVDSTGKSSPVVVKKPIHPDLIANRLIARTIGMKGCFMREIQDSIGSNNVQRISVGDKPGNYFYTIYASSQQIADDTYIALQKHEFDIIRECITHTHPSQSDSDSDSDSDTPNRDNTDDVKVSDYLPSKPTKIYPPGTSWVDMMDDDDDYE